MLGRIVAVGLLVLAAVVIAPAHGADVFNMGPGLTSLEFVPVGNPGNAGEQSRLGFGDAAYYGSVAESFLMGKCEITNAQWCEFLNAKAATSDPYGLYNASMAGSYGGISRTWYVDHYVYSAKGGDANWDNRPVNYVSYWDAARFCNWLHNGQRSDSDIESGAYINIGDDEMFARQAGARFFIPTENEWYKAAYYDPNKDGVSVPGYWDYPTMCDNSTEPSNDLTSPDGGNNANFYQNGYTIGVSYFTTVIGDFEDSTSAYGTCDQGGNLSEWVETDLYGSTRILRGACYADTASHMQSLQRLNNVPEFESNGHGFRIASVPEPSTVALFGISALGLLAHARRRRKK